MIVVPKTTQYRPRRLVAAALYEQAVQKEEALQRHSIVVDAIWDILLYDGLYFVQYLRLQGGIEAPTLEQIQLVIVKQIIAINVAYLEDAHERLLAGRSKLKGSKSKLMFIIYLCL